MKKLGFALGAGGSRGVAHIGFLRAMEEQGIVPDFIAGTSMGSVVGGCYASGMTPDEMEKEILKLKISDIFDLSLNPLGNAALLRSKKVNKKLKKYFAEKTFDDLKIPFECVATDLISGKPVVLGGKDDLCSSVVASSSIPTIFKPVHMNGKVLIDGGVTCRVPIRTVRDMGADIVVAVDVLGKIRPCSKRYNFLSVLLRMADIADSELVKYKTRAQNPDLFLEPDLGDMSQYKFKQIPFAIEKGYEMGRAYAKQIKELIRD